MPFPSDLEIARGAQLKPVDDTAARIDLDENGEIAGLS